MISDQAVRELLYSLSDACPVLMWFSNPNAECLYFNKAWLECRGRSLEQEIGWGWLEGLHPDDRERSQDIFLSAFQERRPAQQEYRLRCADGSFRWFSDGSFPWFTPNGSYQGYIGFAHDITERKEAEEKELWLAAIVRDSVDAIIGETPDGIISSWNPGAERTYGYTAAEVVGQHISVLVPADHLPELERVMQTIRQGRMVPQHQTKQRHKDGRLFDVLATISPIKNKEGEIVGVSAIAQDLTEFMRLEQQYRQAQKLEAVGTLAGGVAHDFNNLLTVINGYSELLIGRLAPNHPLQDMVAEILKAGKQAGTLTRQLLAFSRQQVLEPKVLNLNVVLSDTDKMLRRLIGEDIILTTVLVPALGLVKVDPGQMQQVVMNLVVNARDAMPQGGKLTLETHNVTLDEGYSRTHLGVQPGRYSVLAVSDTGCGMDEATKARIFEPFFTTKGPGKGTGLGLAVVHGMVNQSGGHIEVYSELGHGTTFKLYFPHVQGPVSSGKSQPGVTTMPKGSETVLLVEDDDTVRALARHVLRSCGYTVLEAADGRKAVQLAESHQGPIDLLISDVVMPYLGGRQLAERLVALKPDLKVLFSSGYTDDAIVRHGVLQAEFAFLQKPFTPTALAQKVREVLDDR